MIADPARYGFRETEADRQVGIRYDMVKGI